MRKQFNLQDWLKDKSQRVETRDGRIVHNIWPVKEPLIFNGKRAEVCAQIDGEEDALVFFEGGKYLTVNSESPFDLFIVTPEPTDMSKFGMKVSEFAEAFYLAATDCESEEYKTCNGNLQLIIDKYAAELLSLAINARAKELSDGLKQSKLDKDSIPYHLIEFMCNLYTCQNWKEIVETAELYATRIKAAAMKDLPRWKMIKAFDKLPCRAYLYNLAYERENNYCGRTTIHGLLIPNEAVKVGCDTWYLPVDDIKNLPKED